MIKVYKVQHRFFHLLPSHASASPPKLWKLLNRIRYADLSCIIISTLIRSDIIICLLAENTNFSTTSCLGSCTRIFPLPADCWPLQRQCCCCRSSWPFTGGGVGRVGGADSAHKRRSRRNRYNTWKSKTFRFIIYWGYALAVDVSGRWLCSAVRKVNFKLPVSKVQSAPAAAAA